MSKFNLKWSFGNRKVTKLDAVSFGIPAFESASGFKTCPQAGTCASVCYARQGTYTWPATKKAREFNLERTRLGNAFEDIACKDLAKIKQSIIRIHDSGDFYSQNYLNAWINIAWANPNKIFYAYTKSLNLNFTCAPSNMRITQSQGGKLDDKIDYSKPHSRIFASIEAREKAGYVDGNENDSPAINGEIKIGLVYHGVKKLTEAQNKHFQ